MGSIKEMQRMGLRGLSLEIMCQNTTAKNCSEMVLNILDLIVGNSFNLQSKKECTLNDSL